MAIVFNEQSKTFKLDTSISSYIIKIYEGGYLLNLYYGRKIHKRQLKSETIQLNSDSNASKR